MRVFSFLVLVVNLNFSVVLATVSLGAASTFGALSYASITNTGPTDIHGDIGTTGISITGFPPGAYTGSRYISGAATAALVDATLASEAVAAQPGAITLTGDLGGMARGPGVYRYSSSAILTGNLTLAGTGNCNDTWYFQIGSSLGTSVGSMVEMTGGGLPGNVFWNVGSSATIEVDTDFIGNILATESITMKTGAELQGGAFALGGSITLDSNSIRKEETCSSSTASSSLSSISALPSASASSSNILAPATSSPTPSSAAVPTTSSNTWLTNPNSSSTGAIPSSAPSSTTVSSTSFDSSSSISNNSTTPISMSSSPPSPPAFSSTIRISTTSSTSSSLSFANYTTSLLKASSTSSSLSNTISVSSLVASRIQAFTSATLKGATIAPVAVKPSTTCTDSTTNSGTRNRGLGTRLVFVIAMITMVL